MKPRICLVMIVKNEAAIIARCLRSAFEQFHTFAILDTGSTDDTKAVIRRCLQGQLWHSGKLEDGRFVDFAQARNDALNLARTVPDWDYALLLDADMELAGTLDKASLTAPAYRLKQINGELEYWNTRLLRRDVPAVYKGVTHEFLSVPNLPSPPTIDTCVVQDRNDGGSKGDKTERDIRLLAQGLADEPTNERYMFYLASSYRDAGRHDEAIQWFRKRIAAGGWEEEVWAAHYGIAKCYFALAKEPELAAACLDAHNFRPSRAESLGLLARWYREHGKNDAACLMAQAMRMIQKTSDVLFVDRAVYEHGYDYEMSINGFYSKLEDRRYRGEQSCARLTVSQDPVTRAESRKNWLHYAKSAEELFGSKSSGISFEPPSGWAPMNPSVLVVGSRRYCLVRTVNYKIADGQYPTNDGSGLIRTRNWLLECGPDWSTNASHELRDGGTYSYGARETRSSFPVEGFEDLRLYANGQDLCVSGVVRNLNEAGHCEMMTAHLDHHRIEFVDVVRDFEHEKTQKNWMPIIGQPGAFLYSCDPTVKIARGLGTTVMACRWHPEQNLSDWRGGSQLIPHGDGYLAIVHEVVWAPQRHYLHRFVKFSSDFKIEAFTEPFYFEHKGIEFCAGLARDGEHLVASYGVNDASAHFAFFDPLSVDAMLNACP